MTELDDSAHDPFQMQQQYAPELKSRGMNAVISNETSRRYSSCVLKGFVNQPNLSF
jgi:hypothetical protein